MSTEQISERKIEEMAHAAEELTPEQAEAAQGGAVDMFLKITDRRAPTALAGAGKVSMQDFHFVM